MEEVWKTINGFEKYQISNFGRVKGVKGQIMKGRKSGAGYLVVALRATEGSKNRYIHRVVAEHFIPNPNNLTDVNHIDEDKENNHISNLEWLSHLDNCRHGTRQKRISELTKKQFASLSEEDKEIWRNKGARKSIPVIATSIDGSTTLRFKSINEANRNGFVLSSVQRCIKNKKPYKGFTWTKEIKNG